MLTIDRTKPMPDLTEEVKALGKERSRQAPNAELATLLVGILADPPYTGQKTKPLWNEVVSLLEQHAGPDVVAPLAGLAADYRKVFGPTIMGERVEGQLRKLVATLIARFPDAPRELAAAPVVAPKPQRTDDIWSEIYAHLDDDGPRLVLADALIEEDNPRGEFIFLQLRPELDKAEQKRMAQLLVAHEKEWLGPVADVTHKARVWRRGFLDECSLLPRGKFLAAAVGHRVWSTVRHLTMFSHDADKGAAIVTHPVLRNLRVVENPPDAMLTTMAESDLPWAVERLSALLVRTGSFMPELLAPRGLPSLREIMLTSPFGNGSAPESLRALWPSPLGRQLQVLKMRVYTNFFGAWAQEIMQHAPMPVELGMEVTFRFDGKRLTVMPATQPMRGWKPLPEIVRDGLRALPAGYFESVTVDDALRDGGVDQEVARLC